MKTINRIPKRISKFALFFLLLLTAVIFTTCKDKNVENGIYYYDVYGEGYVYYRDTNLPIKGLKIILKADVDWGGQGLMFPTNPVETLYTDSKGYYRLHFIKKIYGHYPVRYYFSFFIYDNLDPFDSAWDHTGGPDEIKKNKTLINAFLNLKSINN